MTATRGRRSWRTAAFGLALGALVATGAAEGQAAPAGARASETPDEFGTTVSGYSAYDGNQFRGVQSTYAYACSPCDGCVYHNGGFTAADVQLQMPSGSSFKGVRWWGFDNDAEDLAFVVLRACLPAFAAGPPVVTVLEIGTSSGTPGDVSGFIIIPGVETVDNEACTYSVRIEWHASTSMLQVCKVRAQWERQVSPAPAVATFNDVPTNHPFFQFVEALSESGITAGCSAAPPLYCPDAPLTRGQMAVFLAKALGLQWP